jgi:hypothetical protein
MKSLAIVGVFMMNIIMSVLYIMGVVRLCVAMLSVVAPSQNFSRWSETATQV